VLEQIVGKIDDEHDDGDEIDIQHHGDNRYSVRALTPLQDFNEASSPLRRLFSASLEKLMNCGSAVTARTPSTTITVISSTSVNPLLRRMQNIQK